MFPAVYNRTRKATLGPQLGAKTLRDYLIKRFGCTSLGIYNNRSVRGGVSLSRHAAGAAFDAGFPYRVGGTERGWELAQWALANHRALGIQQIIYARRIWTVTRDGEGWRYYGGSAAHYEHVHLELTDQAARELTPTVLARNLNQTEDNDMNIPEAAIETLLIQRLKLAYELFPQRDPDIAGLRYWAGQITRTYRNGGDPDKILHDIELGLLNELPLEQRQELAQLVTDSDG